MIRVSALESVANAAVDETVVDEMLAVEANESILRGEKPVVGGLEAMVVVAGQEGVWDNIKQGAKDVWKSICAFMRRVMTYIFGARDRRGDSLISKIFAFGMQIRGNESEIVAAIQRLLPKLTKEQAEKLAVMGAQLYTYSKELASVFDKLPELVSALGGNNATQLSGLVTRHTEGKGTLAITKELAECISDTIKQGHVLTKDQMTLANQLDADYRDDIINGTGKSLHLASRLVFEHASELRNRNRRSVYPIAFDSAYAKELIVALKDCVKVAAKLNSHKRSLEQHNNDINAKLTEVEKQLEALSKTDNKAALTAATADLREVRRMMSAEAIYLSCLERVFGGAVAFDKAVVKMVDELVK